MAGKALETLFIRIWTIVKLSLFFWLFSSIGAIIFGVGPAWMTVNALFFECGFEPKEMSFGKSWKIYKETFIRSNQFFGLFVLFSLLLIYNLYLSLQIKGLAFLMVDFILLFTMAYGWTAFHQGVILACQYEMSFTDLLKLSVISSFSDFGAFLKIIIGNGVLFWFTWQYKGLILFGFAGLVVIWNQFAVKKWLVELDRRLENYE
ncbi:MULTISPECIES: YesL family protein [unclassified Enterococcus]|jgi:uncharacterized membrane protein YesL|uniref:YesL family protein n=1 Tax=unclassified Enterococcus TaxID=2608891 RepID=UPI003D2BB018